MNIENKQTGKFPIMYLKHERSTSQQTKCKSTKKNFPVKPHFNIPRKDIDRKRKKQ